MKPIHSLMIISSALFIALPSICTAAPRNALHAGPYISGFIGASVPESSNVTTDISTDPSIHEKVDFDPGINIGGTGGYDFGYARLEGEISHKYSEINSITDKSDGYRYRNPDGSLGVTAFMANAFFDLHNETMVTPYLGGGIGFASLHLSDTHATGYRYLYTEDDDTVFAYQIGAGVEIAINRRFSLDIGYRYFGTDTATFTNDDDQWSSLKFKSHNTTIGFRASF